MKTREAQTLTVLSADMENTLSSSKAMCTYITGAAWPLSTPVGFLEREEQRSTTSSYLLFLFLKCKTQPGPDAAVLFTLEEAYASL